MKPSPTGRSRTLALVVASALLAAAACDDDPEPTDGGQQDGGGDELPGLSHGTLDEPNADPADYSNLGTLVRPTAGEDLNATFELREFRADDGELGCGTGACSDVRVWFFSNNLIADACDAPNCREFTTDGAGMFSLSVAAEGWYAYRVQPKDGISTGSTLLGSLQYNEAGPSAGALALQGTAVSQATADVIPATLGVIRTPGSALFAGTVQDAQGREVYGAVIRLFDADGTEIVGGTAGDEPSFRYFDGRPEPTPDEFQSYTNVDGLYLALQIPPASDTRPYRVEAWGNLDGTRIRISCEEARAVADAVTILNLGPLRADAPDSCQ